MYWARTAAGMVRLKTWELEISRGTLLPSASVALLVAVCSPANNLEVLVWCMVRSYGCWDQAGLHIFL